MKTYTAEYCNKTGKIHEATFEAKDQKEAWAMAQLYKKQSPKIQQAGRVKTYVNSKEFIFRKLEKGMRDAEALQKEYNELRAKGQIPKINFLEP